MKIYKNRPRLRKILNQLLKDNPNLTLADFAQKRTLFLKPIYRRVYITAGLRKQARKMLQEKKEVKNG